ncbi:uncharacterized protein LOC129588302 [Paramacrobiotus metropolitanus]|uniref:uncharacterized protein LOC129588302 n=1 Tax=Paramacrobiotus metropolitanus TaxID=2943436 RepID=UPI002445658F|nr:uncharacterized protein LOC129588302 [Paramacrobiotus metropolitanus]
MFFFVKNANLPVTSFCCLWLLWFAGLASSLNITFVTYGFGNVFGRGSGTRHTAAGLDVAISEFNNGLFSTSKNLNLTCSQVILEIANATDCKDAEANANMVADYYYKRAWDDDNIMTLITSGCGDSLIVGSLAGEWDVFMAATAFSYPDTRDRDAYPSYVTFSSIQVSVIVDTMLAFFDRFNWTNAGVIYDMSGLPSYYELIGTMKTQTAMVGSPVQFGYHGVRLDKAFAPKSLLLTVKTYARSM